MEKTREALQDIVQKISLSEVVLCCTATTKIQVGHYLQAELISITNVGGRIRQAFKHFLRLEREARNALTSGIEIE